MDDEKQGKNPCHKRCGVFTESNGDHPLVMNSHESPTSRAGDNGEASDAPAGLHTEIPPVMTKPQLAAILCCTPKHLDNLARRGILIPIHLGRCVRYRRESVLRTLALLERTK
jgi:hypothetical protein